ncbi:MAG: DUF6868 family protein [Sedimentisphaerales bacterium]
MDITAVRAFFMWCTILNGALLLAAFAMWVFAGDFVYRMHSKWFKLSKEAFNILFYSFLGAMKIFVLVFNFVPWMALLIIG